VQSVRVAIHEIEKNQVWSGSYLDALQSFPAAAGGFPLPALADAALPRQIESRMFLAHQQNLSRFHGMFDQKKGEEMPTT
jgi:hypothetical protein